LYVNADRPVKKGCRIFRADLLPNHEFLECHLLRVDLEATLAP
jgi:hypothetical protein